MNVCETPHTSGTPTKSQARMTEPPAGSWVTTGEAELGFGFIHYES